MFQLVTQELIDRLDDVFPPKPTRSMDHRQIDWQIGQQMVIDLLKEWLAEGVAGEDALNPLGLSQPSGPLAEPR
jgi:hypothetical protein